MLKKISSGKVREIYDAGEGRLLIVTSDRISAYDVIMPTAIPGKGKILNGLAEFWFELLGGVIKNHLISTDIKDFPAPFNTEEYAGRTMLVKRLKMLPYECIVRGYITGSAWESYKKDGTACGIPQPEGLSLCDKFPTPLFTPSTKAEEGHDINITFEEMEKGLGSELAGLVRDKTVEIYLRASEYAAKRGIIIADTKLEFGLDENGELVLADEVLTPDSSRFWSAENYEVGKDQSSFDKQYLRDWLRDTGNKGVEPGPELPADVVRETQNKYALAYKLITGKEIA
ncbi:MAG: phosphoribosylaminoimidazolesuccinocarboxamide synthase [Clostridia bacterium]|nr:phosphoribosylaminoimidazolesuccinocarboxamide synthase [Clostridia bacterium]